MMISTTPMANRPAAGGPVFGSVPPEDTGVVVTVAAGVVGVVVGGSVVGSVVAEGLAVADGVAEADADAEVVALTLGSLVLSGKTSGPVTYDVDVVKCIHPAKVASSCWLNLSRHTTETW